MSQNQQYQQNQQNQQYYQYQQQPAGSSRSESSSKGKADEWAGVSDPAERRKIQNKYAQRRYREKVRDQKEEDERRLNNQRYAGSSYTTADPRTMDNSNRTLSGVPWGGPSMRHIMEQGRTSQQQSQQSSRETSVYGGYNHSYQGRTSQGGGSSG